MNRTHRRRRPRKLSQDVRDREEDRRKETEGIRRKRGPEEGRKLQRRRTRSSWSTGSKEGWRPSKGIELELE